eukprot:Skav234935  [mRNA]  locus=scaffold2677:139002:139325:- [translate_table: standard]
MEGRTSCDVHSWACARQRNDANYSACAARAWAAMMGRLQATQSLRPALNISCAAGPPRRPSSKKSLPISLGRGVGLPAERPPLLLQAIAAAKRFGVLYGSLAASFVS